MKKMQLSKYKTLKLTNVLSMKITIRENECDLNTIIEQMEAYIKTKGALQIGPLIQYSRTFVNDNDELDMEVVIMMQCNNFIHNVKSPYSMNAIIRVSKCIYCRFMGPENKLKLAYDKINVEAFESDIKLKGDNYTIFLDRNEDEDYITADVFMECIEQ